MKFQCLNGRWRLFLDLGATDSLYFQKESSHWYIFTKITLIVRETQLPKTFQSSDYGWWIELWDAIHITDCIHQALVSLRPEAIFLDIISLTLWSRSQLSTACQLRAVIIDFKRIRKFLVWIEMTQFHSLVAFTIGLYFG